MPKKPTTDPLARLANRIAKRLATASSASATILLPPVPDTAVTLVQRALLQQHPVSLLLVEDPHMLDVAHRNAVTGGIPEEQALYFPLENAHEKNEADLDLETTGHRQRVLLRLLEAHSAPLLIVAPASAAAQPCPTPAALQSSNLSCGTGDVHEPEKLAAALHDTGYTFVPLVQEPGQAALRGGILDAWSPTAPAPLRLDFFGDQLESIRSFDPVTQHSVETVDEARLAPCRMTPNTGDDPATLLDYLPSNTAITWLRPDAIAEHLDMLRHYDSEAGTTSYRDLSRQAAAMASVQLFIGSERASVTQGVLPTCTNLPVYLPAGALLPDQYESARKRMADHLCELAADNFDILLYFDTEGTREHALNEFGKRLGNRAITTLGVLSEGCVFPDEKLVIVAESDLYGRRKESSRRYNPRSSRIRPASETAVRLTRADELEYGDLVVHVEHGIGRYEGTREIQFNGKQQEVISVEYADDARLFVPLSHAHFLSRYIGVAGRGAKLHRLGGRKWGKDRKEAEEAILDMAAGLMDVQAARNLLKGHTFGTDTPWQIEFEHAFPFQETEDQTRVITEVKADMESSRPMDRLICGDAGYGKTEVAMRAAFKAVMEGRQICVLVPTTVLAQQHYQTFSERMAGYPVRVECLSRFTGTRQRRKILDGMRDGSVDIVIGTHTLVQDGIRFATLGLVIIDEEQRFGVKHKEKLKELKRLVDVLTLSATPIPRTLYMSMTGVRDMSLLRTPPRERMAIETVVSKDTDAIVRKAIRRELARDGQVFFLHNRVMSIEIVHTRLEQLLPDARIEVAHGQMPAHQLSEVMRRFSARQADVLLCTTIIESGVDIPLANTIIIDRADRFGLADLYQLRGRVGRSNRKAYAYLLLPAHGHIDAEARERIKAIRRFSALGAGFGLAMRDLELRGAGNILGAAQSGHIAAIGFGLYCQLLKRSVAKLQGEEPPPIVETEINFEAIHLAPESVSRHTSATIPYSYIEEEQIRVNIYRRLAEATSQPDVDDLRSELVDRFGQPPDPADRLLRLTALRVQAAAKSVRRIDVKGSRLLLMRKGEYLMERGRFPTLKGHSVDEQMAEIADMIDCLAP